MKHGQTNPDLCGCALRLNFGLGLLFAAVHDRYVDALSTLHEANKEKYPLHGGVVSQLRLVD